MSHFSFKQFKIHHDRSTMKVGTDGVLLGAWAEVDAAENILDIGCGSGLVAIMAAQRCRGKVTGIEIDEASAQQAAKNAAASPFASRLTMVSCDIRRFSPETPFDCVLSNPPYFEEDLLPPDPKRAAARHTDALSFQELIASAVRLMTPEAAFHVVLPHAAGPRFVSLCREQGLSLQHQTNVITLPGKAPKRVLLRFVRSVGHILPVTDDFLLCNKDNTRSEQYRQLTEDFYL